MIKAHSSKLYGVTRTLIVMLFTVSFAGCVPWLPDPAGDKVAAVGISVENRWNSMGWFASQPEWVHFVRWNDDDDVTSQTEIVTSNYQRGNRIYLLNAKPGRYSAIASTEVGKVTIPGSPLVGRAGRGIPRAVPVSWRGSEGAMLAQKDDDDRSADEVFIQTTYFSEDLIRKSTTEVTPGSLAFMGHYLVVRDVGISQGDRAQRYFHPLQNPELLDYQGLLVIPTQSSESWSVRFVRRDKQAHAEFLTGALDDLGGTSWEPIVRRSLETLRNKQ